MVCEKVCVFRSFMHFTSFCRQICKAHYLNKVFMRACLSVWVYKWILFLQLNFRSFYVLHTTNDREDWLDNELTLFMQKYKHFEVIFASETSHLLFLLSECFRVFVYYFTNIKGNVKGTYNIQTYLCMCFK